MTLASSTAYSPDSLLELRFSGSADFTGLLVVADKGSFPFAMLPKYLKPGLCAPMASVTHVDGDAKSANFTLSWLAPPPGAGPIRFVAMVFGSRSGKNCDYYGADVVLSEGPATPRPTPRPTPPPPPTPPTTSTPRPASTAPIPTPPTRPVLSGSDVVIYARHSILRLVTYDPGDQWDRISFVDMHWRPATAPIGFGYPVGDFGTTAFGASLRAPLTDVYVRTHFELLAEQVSAVKSAVLKLAVDDSADIVFNEQVLDASASLGKVFTAKYWTQEIVVPISALKVGDNLIAAHVANIATTSTLLFDLELHFNYDGNNPAPTTTSTSTSTTSTTSTSLSQGSGPTTMATFGTSSAPNPSSSDDTASETTVDASPAAPATAALLTIVAIVVALIALH
jgi:hypothetical protein